MSAHPDEQPDDADEPRPDPAPDPAPDLPPLDSIGPGTDLAPWLRAGIPAALKNAALRRKWLTTPAIRDYVDPALDYAWDWNAAAAVPGAGGRILPSAADKMLRALTESPRPQPAPDADAVAEAPPEPAPASAPEPPPEPAAAQAPVDEAPPAARAEAAPAPRRRHGGAAPRIGGPTA